MIAQQTRARPEAQSVLASGEDDSEAVGAVRPHECAVHKAQPGEACLALFLPLGHRELRRFKET